MDASNVYGSDDATALALRTLEGGLLKTSGDSLLPVTEIRDDRSQLIKRLFVAGDERTREVPGLAAMHTVFVMEHNRVAKELARRIQLTDEMYYQVWLAGC